MIAPFDAESQILKESGALAFYDHGDEDDLKEFVFAINGDLEGTFVVLTENVQSCFESLKSFFQYIEAAGGVVRNNKDEILWIKRLGVWDLPKGKIEIGEESELAAIREVEEETGIVQPIIEQHLLNTYHTYVFKGENVLKCTYWYEMRYNGNDNLVPQVEEDIEEVIWQKDTSELVQKTYQNIIDVYNCSQKHKK